MFQLIPSTRTHFLSACALGGVLLCSGLPARADAVVYSNLGGTTVDADPIDTFGPIADSFSSGGYSSTLNAVTVLLSGAPDGGSLAASLLSNSGNTPGSEIATLGTIQDSSLSSSLRPYTLTLPTPVFLDPSTRYWVNLQSNSSSAAWAWSYDTNGTGVGGEYLANTNGVFSSDDEAPYQMEVVTSTPEPGNLALLGGLLLGVVALLRRLRVFTPRT